MSDLATEPTVVPGTGETPAPTADSSAGTQNTDGQPGGPPETIPYSRFKEVNDALHPYKELEGMGYDADSLRRLAEWEVAFSAAPAESWMSLADRIEGLPEPVKEAIRQASDASTQTPPGSDPTPSGEPNTDGPPEWAAPLVQDYHQRLAAGENAARKQVLDGILSKWDEMDKADGLMDTEGKPLIPPSIRLSFIAGAAGGASNAEEILETARKEALELLEIGKRSVIVPAGAGTPRPVPGSAVATGAPPVKIRTLAEATAAAKADLAAGRLVSG